MQIFKTLYIKNQKGIALLIVLMVISILAAVIVEFSYSARVSLNIVGNQKDELKAYYIARAGIEASKAILRYDLKKDGIRRVDYIVSGEEADPEVETWSQVRALTSTEFGGIPIGDGILVGGITDESSKININRLVYDKNGKALEENNSNRIAVKNRVIKLLDNVLPDDIDAEPGDIADNIIDWIDDDDGGEAEDDYYQGLTPPYECKDAPINSISELKMVRGINDAIYEAIEKYFTPYGEDKVNINTASAEVIMVLGTNPNNPVDRSAVEEWIRAREEDGRYCRSPGRAINGINSNYSGCASNYFSIECTGIVNLGKETEYSKTIKAIVKRNKKPPIEVLYWKVE